MNNKRRMSSVAVSCLSMLFLLLAAAANSSASPVGEPGRVITHKENRQALRTWNCKTPQSKLVYIADVLRERGIHELGMRYDPPAVVVRQCTRESGCCFVEDQSCQSKEQETVQYEILAFRPPKAKKRTVMTVNIVNDVSCECRSSIKLAI